MQVVSSTHKRIPKEIKHEGEVTSARSGISHLVREYTDGSWWCDCLAWKNNHASPDVRHCRHTRAAERGEWFV